MWFRKELQSKWWKEKKSLLHYIPAIISMLSAPLLIGFDWTRLMKRLRWHQNALSTSLLLENCSAMAKSRLKNHNQFQWSATGIIISGNSALWDKHSIINYRFCSRLLREKPRDDITSGIEHTQQKKNKFINLEFIE